jgi:hypothetical protein
MPLQGPLAEGKRYANSPVPIRQVRVPASSGSCVHVVWGRDVFLYIVFDFASQCDPTSIFDVSSACFPQYHRQCC